MIAKKKIIKCFYISLTLSLISVAIVVVFLKSSQVFFESASLITSYITNSIFFSFKAENLIPIIIRLILLASSIGVIYILYSALSIIISRLAFEFFARDLRYKKHYLPELVYRGIFAELYRLFSALRPLMIFSLVTLGFLVIFIFMFNIFLVTASITIQLSGFIMSFVAAFLGLSFVFALAWFLYGMLSTFYCSEITSSEPELTNKQVINRANSLFDKETLVVVLFWIVYSIFMIFESIRLSTSSINAESLIALILFNIGMLISLKIIKTISYLRNLINRYKSISLYPELIKEMLVD